MINPLIEPAPVLRQSLNNAHNAGRQHVWWRCQDARQLSAQEPKSLAYSDAALEQKGADLIDDAGALADQSFAYPTADSNTAVACPEVPDRAGPLLMRLHVELVGRLRRYKLHRWALHRFGDPLCITKVSRQVE